MPIGHVTRGTTGTNRLRRIDRWIAQLPAFTKAEHPLVVDLGYGASATTSLELHQRLSKTRSDVEVVGIEIEPERVRIANERAKSGVSFRLGGFEVPGERPIVIRALNVLRQYNEDQVEDAWRRMIGRLQPGGVLVEGTCNEVGRIASWVDATTDGPQTLTISLRLAGLDQPSIVAERLPKVLIHRNVPGERIHELMKDLDRWWAVHSGLGVYSPAQRWVAVVQSLKQSGWPVLGVARRWRLGELTVAWDAVAPVDYHWK